MHLPSMIFGAAAAENVAVGQLHGFVLDRAENAIGQAHRLGPGFAVVLRSFHHAPPGGRLGTDFVEEKQWTVSWLKQDRIPAGEPVGFKTDAIRNFHWRRPLAIRVS